MGMKKKAEFSQVGRVRPDRKGRVTLGKLAANVSSYLVRVDRQGQILLEPFTEIPARERWRFENRLSRSNITREVADAAAGRHRPRGAGVRR